MLLSSQQFFFFREGGGGGATLKSRSLKMSMTIYATLGSTSLRAIPQLQCAVLPF